MNCNDILSRLDGLRAGTLPAGEADLVKTHLSTCAACTSELAFLERLEADVARLPEGIAPPRDLWPGIDARLAPSRPARRWLALAAVITLVAIGGAVAAALLSPAPAETDTVAAMESDYRSAASELLRTVEARQGELTPGVVRVVEQNLQITNAAITELQEALREQPGDPGLEWMLRAAWEKKLDLLRRAAASPEV